MRRKSADKARNGLDAPADDPADAEASDPHGGALTLAGQRIARELGPRLSRLLGGETPIVSSIAPRVATGADLAAIAGPIAGNSLFAIDGDATRFVMSVEATAVLRLLDRTFGGRGELPNPMPTVLPLSSQLLVERLEAVIAEAVATARDIAGEQPAALRRDGDLAQITPFAADQPLRLFGFDIAEAGAKTWRLTLAFPETGIGALFDLGMLPKDDEPTAASSKTVRAGPRVDPRIGPFAEMPLPLTATLVDMAIPLARLSRLRVGDVLPVAVARSVPLHLGGKTIARGSIGAFDDRVAVRVSEAFQ